MLSVTSAVTSSSSSLIDIKSHVRNASRAWLLCYSGGTSWPTSRLVHSNATYPTLSWPLLVSLGASVVHSGYGLRLSR